MKTKKMYLTPSIRTAELLESVHLMAGSGITVGGGEGPSENPGFGAGDGPGDGGAVAKKKDGNDGLWGTDSEAFSW